MEKDKPDGQAVFARALGAARGGGGDERAAVEREESLVARAGAGDIEAFGKLVELHKERVYSLAVRMTGDPAAAEDLAQDVFVKAFRRIDRFRGDSRFSTWLYSITANRCRDYLKSPRRREVGAEALLDRPHDGLGPEEKAGFKETTGRLEKAILALSPKYREAFLLRFVEGLEFKEIARAIGRSESGAKMRVARALAKVREAIVREKIDER